MCTPAHSIAGNVAVRVPETASRTLHRDALSTDALASEYFNGFGVPYRTTVRSNCHRPSTRASQLTSSFCVGVRVWITVSSYAYGWGSPKFVRLSPSESVSTHIASRLIPVETLNSSSALTNASP